MEFYSTINYISRFVLRFTPKFLRQLFVTSTDDETEQVYNYIPVYFSNKVRSDCVRLNEENLVAERINDRMLDKNFVFLTKKFTEHHCIAVQIIDIDECYLGNLTFGLLWHEPSVELLKTLTSDADKLHMKQNYWILKRLNVMSNKGDILLFWFDGKRNVIMRKNNGPELRIFERLSGNLYPFFDLSGSVTKICAYMSINSCNGPPHLPTNLRDLKDNSKNKDETESRLSAAVTAPQSIEDDLKINLSGSEPSAGTKELYIADDNELVEEVPEGSCIQCKKQPANIILYRCGHNCLCRQCTDALIEVAGVGKAHCPLCNEVIQDIIVSYAV